MKRKKRILFLKILFLLVLSIGVSICIKIIFFPDENAKIRKTISMVIDELENKNIGDFIKHFTLDYRDCFGNTYGTLYIYLKNNVDMLKSIDIGLGQMEIEIEKPDATVRFMAKAIVVTSDGEVYKEAGRFVLKMRKEDFRWKIYRLDEMEYNFD